jgi:thioredoxin reductase
VVDTPDGEQRVLARAVIDASGTWGRPNPLGANGVWASGEPAVRDRIAYGIPDVLGADRSRYAGRRVLVVGSGHSAFNALLDLADLEKETPEGEVTWAIRRSEEGRMFGGGTSDALLARASLGRVVEGLVERGACSW